MVDSKKLDVRNQVEEALVDFRTSWEKHRGTEKENSNRRARSWAALRAAVRQSPALQSGGECVDARELPGGSRQEPLDCSEDPGSAKRASSHRKHKRRKQAADTTLKLLHKGQDAKREGHRRLGELLLEAAKLGDERQVAAILGADSGPPVTWADEGGSNALHWASLYGHLEVVRVLAGAGAAAPRRVDRANKAGHTALHYACLGRHAGIAHLLSAVYKADPYAANPCGQTPVSLGLRALLQEADSERHLAERQATREAAVGDALRDGLWELSQRAPAAATSAGGAAPTPPGRRLWEAYEAAWAGFCVRFSSPRTWRAPGDAAQGLADVAELGRAAEQSAAAPFSEVGRPGAGGEGVPVAGGGGSIELQDVPWPFRSGFERAPYATPGGEEELLLEGLQVSPAERRALLRRELVRWHPDKFEQFFGRSLAAVHRACVLERVGRVSQTLNRYRQAALE